METCGRKEAHGVRNLRSTHWMEMNLMYVHLCPTDFKSIKYSQIEASDDLSDKTGEVSLKKALYKEVY